MRKHMDVFLYLTLMRQHLNLSSKEIKPFLERTFSFPYMLPEHVDHIVGLFTRYPPDNTKIVQYMKKNGYSPGYIGKYLNISPGTISYHLSKADSPDYINGYVLEYIQGLQRQSSYNA